MAGTKTTEVAGGGDLEDSERTARAEAQHWRDLAVERGATLHALTRRPLVRIAVGLDRRFAPAGHHLGSWRAHLHAAADRSVVAMATLPARASRGRRRTTLAREVARLKPAPVGPTVSVITFAGWGDETWRHATGASPQVVIVGEAVSPQELRADVRVLGEGRSRVAALALGASAAAGDVLCFVPEPVEAPAPGWLARLAAALVDGVVAATPTLLHPQRSGWQTTEHDLLVRSEGFEVELDASGAPIVMARGPGNDPRVEREAEEVVAAPLLCLVVDRAAYVAAGGLGTADVDDVAAVDLCTRLRHRGGRVLHVPTAMAFDDRPVASRLALRRPIDPGGPAWHWCVERNGPAVARAARAGDDPMPARWVITTAAPSARVASRWGDWHVAEGLARSLRRLGQDVHVQTHDRADSLEARSHDIHLVLHGLAPVRRTPGQLHIVWVISHPESLDIAECDAADLVLVASSRFAADLRTRTSTPVEVFLQATDADRFHPQPPDPGHQHPVTVVAKTRDVLRPVVADALAAGVRPAIYGSGWRELVDPSLVISDHIDNDAVPAVYSSAGVVLNDHWDTMRAWGFVSNRIFDVLACGVPIISDDLSEIHDLFGEAVATYRTSAELGELVRRALEDPDRARAVAAGGRATVLAHHTFDHRAHKLLDLLERYELRYTQPTMEGTQ